MNVPQYITSEVVRKICKEIGIRDWTKLKDPKATTQEAQKILKAVNTEKMPIDVEEFRAGLDVELEHGTRFKDANITSNHPVVTGKIVLAHMKESLDYYKLLEVAELEGDVLKAVAAGNVTKIRAKYKKLAEAKIALQKAALKRLGKSV
ncbi:MAG: hypothetical protein NTV89_15155 [Proteobacteria bacterium]|nr:hypothetical protein [Pseudomonadota bacterium]